LRSPVASKVCCAVLMVPLMLFLCALKLRKQALTDIEVMGETEIITDIYKEIHKKSLKGVYKLIIS